MWPFIEYTKEMEAAFGKSKKGKKDPKPPDDENEETFLGPILCGLIFLVHGLAPLFCNTLYSCGLLPTFTSPVSAWTGVPP